MTDGALNDRRSRLLLIGSVAVAVFMARLDIYIVNISLPTIARDLDESTSAVSWVSMGYLLEGPRRPCVTWPGRRASCGPGGERHAARASEAGPHGGRPDRP